jgi:thiamine-phosphate pyrophosphorylase
MDGRLVAWGRAVLRRGQGRLPVLWLFTDAARGGDPVAAVGRLPKGGLCGVVFRHDGVAGRAELFARVAQACRARGVALVAAGMNGRGVGVHLRGGRGPKRGYGIVTASAHGVAEVVRARRAGACIIFVSPVFATGSHPGEAALGPWRWNKIARYAGNRKAYALGGVDGGKINRLAGFCGGAGAISALI